ncbi:uncharacterized protein CANTADRAFT_5730 [Suhomyces tanzawaensis NRRL Y-17324]|uniref:Myosin-binding domain-containing protein n=1 Tax=Suhomyces tanzawaensis NRRL Y-17324 TaxID=984487 RepID=A0A1E4SKT9_9ASCO|nr:uncharacterized protein CANTADRAFT_5730 [Suhomyces tanzawaensis NRRL Y-17324]ODV80057.1 hypothetical protein CANTADRAFT_5730 [Suhomyces tanzawaensis NRRL Y-17324]
MNFDRLNPLSNYLSKNGMEMSDWGIEETSSRTTSHFLGYDQLRRPSVAHQLYFDDLQSNHLNHDFQYYYHKHNANPILATTENFAKFIKKYLSLQNVNGEFWEKFKYNLVVSNVLDDSMILSKNEQSLNELMRKQADSDHPRKSFENHPTFIDGLNSDGSRLTVLNVNYNLSYPFTYNNFNYIIPIINLVIFLLKQRHHHVNHNQITTPSQVKLFKILLIVSSKLFKYKRFNHYIKTSQNLLALNNFLLLNYKLNKKIITNLLAYKEMEVFNFLDQTPAKKAEQTGYKKELKKMLLHSLDFLNFNLRSSITQLLPYLNGELFEQYCMINNINIDILCQDFEDSNNDEDLEKVNNPLEAIIFSIKKFNQLRKLLICQLLTFNEVPIKKNFFIYKLMDQFHMDSLGSNSLSESISISSIQKLNILARVFNEHNQVLDNFNCSFERFDQLHSNNPLKESKPTVSLEHQDILAIKDIKQSLKIDNDQMAHNGVVTMINKLSNLTTNLKFFNKYNQSTKDIKNVDELNEKIMIFHQFSDELSTIKQLYQLNLADLQNELMNQNGNLSPSSSRSSSGLTSPRTSMLGHQGLKSFHNSTIKKRYSLPVTTSLKLPNSPISPVTPMMDPTPSHGSEKSPASLTSDSSGKKYKRLSTGLQLGLLTVFEDTAKESNASSKRISGGTKPRISNTTFLQNKDELGVAYDDNYINILPPTSYETYNKSALDQLSNGNHSKKHSLRNSNRFSMNSMNSNVSGISDLISSTQITSYIEDEENNDELIKGNFSRNGHQHISKEELRLKLEESFSRIYSLENENKILKLNRSNEEMSNELGENSHNTQDRESTIRGDHTSGVQPHEISSTFLTELEQTLNRPNVSNEVQ